MTFIGCELNSSLKVLRGYVGEIRTFKFSQFLNISSQKTINRNISYNKYFIYLFKDNPRSMI